MDVVHLGAERYSTVMPPRKASMSSLQAHDPPHEALNLDNASPQLKSM